jgi:RecA/RadA recombinase
MRGLMKARIMSSATRKTPGSLAMSQCVIFINQLRPKWALFADPPEVTSAATPQVLCVKRTGYTQERNSLPDNVGIRRKVKVVKNKGCLFKTVNLDILFDQVLINDGMHRTPH